MAKSETEFETFITSQGWEATRGFPDYCCFRDNRFILVEVKGAASESLAPHQLKIMQALASKGIKCQRWSPDTKELEAFDRARPRKIEPNIEDLNTEVKRVILKRQREGMSTELLTFPEAALKLGKKRQLLYYYIRLGRLHPVVLYGRPLLTATEVETLGQALKKDNDKEGSPTK